MVGTCTAKDDREIVNLFQGCARIDSNEKTPEWVLEEEVK